MSGAGHNSLAPDRLKSLVERIERLEAEIAGLNADKSDTYKEAASDGFNKKALRQVVAFRRKLTKGADEARSELDDFHAYLAALGDGA